jgi:hypothetical protein
MGRLGRVAGVAEISTFGEAEALAGLSRCFVQDLQQVS